MVRRRRGGRPIVVTVAAVLQLVFGGLGLLCGIFSAAIDLTGGRDSLRTNQNTPESRFQEASQKLQREKAPAWQAYSVTNQVTNCIFSCMMVASGIGLLRMAQWGRILALVYAGLSVVKGIVVMAYNIVVLNPLADEALHTLPAQDRQAVEPIMTFAMVFAVAGMVLVMIYPIAIAVIVLLPSVNRAFAESNRRPRRSTRSEDLEYDTDDEEGPETDFRRRGRW
jgi:hypothetical protein